MRIADASNTYQYALHIMIEKGYKIFIVPDEREDYFGNYWAIKGKDCFIADNPLSLLGLMNIGDFFGEKWYSAPITKNIDSILAHAFPESADYFRNLSSTAFQNLVDDYKMLFEALYINQVIWENISPEALFELITNYYKEG